MLIETAELEACLGDDNLRVIDCNVILTPKAAGGYEVKSGKDDWQAAHIPGSTFIDFEAELSADHPTLRYMLPTAEQFAAVMSEHGVGNEHRVIVYSRGGSFWATRLYFMFREFGFTEVAVLNGAWDKWVSEGRPVTTKSPDWPQTRFHAAEPEGRFVGKEEVLAALGDPACCVMNALTPATHSGETFNPTYGRPGRIEGSVNVFCMTLIDPETNCFLEPNALVEQFGESGALDQDRVIVYCGGGISATTNAFALQLLGKDNVVVYDGSLMEWGNDPNLPMETGT